MTRGIRTLATALLALLLISGCSTAPLGGTSWRVVKVLAPEEPDFESFTIEFKRDGTMVTTEVNSEGEVVIDDEQRYRVDGRMFVVRGPDGELDMLYRFDDGRLRLVSERFHAILEPLGTE
jgi:hypothetical protein